MSKTEPSTFKDSVLILLAERKELRLLCEDLQRINPTYNRERIAVVEARISELVLGPLGLERGDCPADPHLAQACQRLPFLLTDREHPEHTDNPNRVWDGQVSVVVGVSATNWHPLLKSRLLALCGPLDQPLSKLLEAEANA